MRTLRTRFGIAQASDGSRGGLTRQLGVRISDEELERLLRLTKRLGKSPTRIARALFDIGLDLAEMDQSTLRVELGLPIITED